MPPIHPPPPPPSLRTTRDLFPRPPYTATDDDDDDNLTSMQRFLLRILRTGGERVAEVIGQELTRTTLQRVTFSDNITHIFPQSRKIMEKMDSIEEEDSTSDLNLSEIQTAAREMNHGKVP